MNEKVLPIAVDAMGGDRAPSTNVEGAINAVKIDARSVILVGDEAILRKEVDRFGGTSLLGCGLDITHAPTRVQMDEKAAHAARTKKDSSMRIACELVKSGEAAAALSAGNSGAMMAIALLVHKRLRGVLRPCIATAFPARYGPAILVDAGANVDCSPQMLLQFGVMGAIYMERAFEISQPALGVIANGSESSKGNELTRSALALFEETDLNFVGHVEPRDLLISGRACVGVCDGFTGNIMLKTGESAFRLMGEMIRDSFEKNGALNKVAGFLSQKALSKVRKNLDPREYGAAPLLGLRKPAFIAHGSSDAYAIRQSIRAAHRFCAQDITGKLKAALESLPTQKER